MANDFEALVHHMTRFWDESTRVNTINVRDRVTIDFVWYPGASRLQLVASMVDVRMSARRGRLRAVKYRWTRTGQAAVQREMAWGQITLRLPRGATGELSVFGTTWRITRPALGVNMDPVTNLRGVQQRLNRLGYHLRRPGQRNPGVDNALGRRTESAILDFQVDYQPAAGAPAAAANRLRVRGEWTTNAAAQFQQNLNQYRAAGANPSAADGAAFQASLGAAVP